MRSLSIALVVIALTGIGCTQETIGRTTGALGVETDCDVNAYGVFPSGDEFNGTASDIAGIETIDWEHLAPGFTFNTSSIAPTPPSDILCRENTFHTADLISQGTATVNGVPGYSYVIEIEDNRPAPTIVCTCDGDDDRGHGNDSDCSDEDNPGRSSGCNRGGNGHGHAHGHDRFDDCECVPVPAPGVADHYSLTIFDPSGAVYDGFSGSVEDGDIDITPL